jgi:hypothetical protein
MAPIDNLLATRKALIKRITKTQSLCLDINKPTVTLNEVDLLAIDVAEQKVKAEDLYEKTCSICTEEEFEDHDPDFDTIFAALKKMQIGIMTYKEVKAAAKAASTNTAFKLDKIGIPEFSGKFTDWESFHDIFLVAVHNNPTVAGGEKLMRLKKALTGEAAAIVSSFTSTAANYQQAWDLLCKRYENKRELVFAHLKKLDDVKPLQSESAAGLRSISDALNECVRALTVLKVPVDKWDLILIFYSQRKLDVESRKQWCLEQKPTLPTLQEFLDFVELRARAFADSASSSSKIGSSSSSEKKKGAHHSSTPPTCHKCSGAHSLTQCSEFCGLPVKERKQVVSRNNLCFNCMGKGHGAATCKSKFTCRTCQKQHHSLLHDESQVRAPAPQTGATPQMPNPTPSTTVNAAISRAQNQKSRVMLLGTLIVNAVDSVGEEREVRVFVDGGSEMNFISERCVDMLGLRRKKSCVKILGIGSGEEQESRGIVSLKIFSRVREFSLVISALILKKITELLPSSPCQQSWPHLEDLELGDPNFHQPGPTDVLLGAEFASFILLPGFRKGPTGSPMGQNTQFGWMLSGPSATDIQNSNPSNYLSRRVRAHHAACHKSGECLEKAITKFWEMEEPDHHEIPQSTEDEECEIQFVSTHRRNEDGGYTVTLPFKKPSTPLGHSRQAAVKRFQRVENRLAEQPAIKAQYVAGMRESINAGFMELVPPEKLEEERAGATPEVGLDHYYMPHREVLKPTNTTTKCRIVFDASAKTSSGVSLNDVLMTGPKLQVDIVPLFIRFRSHIVAMSADIVKFYPQFHVSSKQTDYQRLVWREEPQDPLLDYRMVRLTFGVTTAPYLAIRCLHQLAEDEKEAFPLVPPIFKNDFLVDNLLSGADSVESALLLQNQIRQVMDRGNLKLRKWASNCNEILDAVPPEHREGNSSLSIDETDSVKTIGLNWNPKSDQFGVSIFVPDISQPCSKRQVLSAIAKIFDPLGWLAPVTVRPKILMQKCWKAKLDWDSPLPDELQKEWNSYVEELPILEKIKIDRCILSPPHPSSRNCKYELHGFSDASEDSYSACAYIRTYDEEGRAAVKLVAGKTKVAPIKAETIPRLELCGTVLISKLIKTVQDSLPTKFETVRCWTDSTCVLGWLNSKKKLPVFVINRVRKVEAIVPSHLWAHVPGRENPADCASRGISASALINHPLWFDGPPWLKSYQAPATVNAMISRAVPVKEEESQISLLIKNCSSFTRMKRVVAYCLRFLNNSRPGWVKRSGFLTCGELNAALIPIVKNVQSEEFQEEILKCEKSEAPKSGIKFLAPFLDSNGILRVGGRLRLSSVPYNRKHPILLPRKHNLSETIVRFNHVNHLHAGPQLLLALTRDQFWILRGVDVAKKIVRACVVCHRHNSQTSSQLMGQLPSPRTVPSRPFSQCGVDYAGPFYLCLKKGRNPTITKAYVCLFVCMATRAIHLELVSDLSTPAFIAALIRFTSRRGLPADIYCDGGKNFEGASNEIKEFLRFVRANPHNKAVSNFLGDKGVTYHFNPPLAPHHGGLWEAGVKSMKHHLKRTVENRKLTSEEFLTLLTQVEAALNSRPLTQMSTDPNDFGVLTPGHFLVGDSLVALPQDDLTHLSPNRLTRWQEVQQMYQHIWRRFESELLSPQHLHYKWPEVQPNLEPGTLVLIRDDEPSWGPLKWKRGRIVATFPGRDGLVRSCDVRAANGSVYRRSITKLSPLPIYNK